MTIMEAIAALERAVDELPDSHPEKPGLLMVETAYVHAVCERVKLYPSWARGTVLPLLLLPITTMIQCEIQIIQEADRVRGWPARRSEDRGSCPTPDPATPGGSDPAPTPGGTS